MEKQQNFEELFICGGCNAKIGPGNLSKLLEGLPKNTDPRLLVGFDSADDAGVIKVSEDLALIQTLDFFPTMVSDPYLFGKIAAANALSDVYAMGGSVLSAMNIVCFPEDIAIEALGEILRGGAEKVKEAGGILAGGHSIHDATPKYGLSVTGTVHPAKIIKNNTAQPGDILILTKPLGVGIITTAYGLEEVSEAVFKRTVASMATLNKYAAESMSAYPVNSCTDVTGFGLLGHLAEMMSETCSAEIYGEQVPYIKEAYACAEEFFITAGGQRNRNFLSDKVQFDFVDFPLEEILFDPQTSGGLLMSVPESVVQELLTDMVGKGIEAAIIGKVVPKAEQVIRVMKERN